MKTFLHFNLRNTNAFLFIVLFISATAFAQNPQYYNYSTGGGPNSYPLNVPTGKMVQWLVAPGEFNQPAGARTGNITKFYCRIASGYPLGTFYYFQFKLIFGQTTLTALPSGVFFTGTTDTVFKRDTVLLQGAADTWLSFTLDHPFAFDSTKSLVIQIAQCMAPGANGYSLAHTTLSVFRRSWSAGGCPFVYSGSGNEVINCGIDVTPFVGVQQTGEKIPKVYSLGQNYPNPFNPITKISYGIPKSEFVKITVLDVLGRVVSVPVNEFKTAGSYSVEFDASELSSGVYFYRLEAGDFRDVKKMTLVK